MAEPQKIHRDITVEAVIEAYERGTVGLDNPGFCLSCGLEADGCEPDMTGGECESCGEKTVEGVGNLLELMA